MDAGLISAAPSLGSLRAFSPTPSASRSPRLGLTPSASSTLTPENRSLPPSPSYDQTQHPGTPHLSWRDGHHSVTTSPRNSNSADSFHKAPQNGTPPLRPVGGLGRHDSSDDIAPLRSDVFGGSTSGSPVNGASRENGRSAAVGLGVGSVGGLNVPTSRADKRRSVNPGFSLAAAVNSYSGEQSMEQSKPVNPSADSGRLSPHPPSPLRASFTDFSTDAAHALDGQPTMRTAVSPSPAGRRSPRPAETASPQQSSGGPPRSSSLADSLNIQSAPARRQLDSPVATETSSPATIRPPDVGNSPGQQGNYPKIDAPTLPAMHFSLSDPDFAHLLRDSDGSPVKKGVPGQNDVGSAKATSYENAAGASAPSSVTKSPLQALQTSRSNHAERPGSAPSSPLSATSPTFSTSHLKNGGDGERDAHLPFKTDVFRSSSGSTVHRLESHESGTSVGGHNYPESVLPVLQALLAKAGGAEEGQVQIDLLTVHKAVREIEHLTDSAADFRQKYIGAKVGLVLTREPRL